jgi:hypothetical protein
MFFNSLGIFFAHLISAKGKQSAYQKYASSTPSPAHPHYPAATHTRSSPTHTTSPHTATSHHSNTSI